MDGLMNKQTNKQLDLYMEM